MRLGSLRHTITIEKNTPTRDDAGGEVNAWTTHAKARARVEPMTGREYVGSEQLTDSTTHKFTLRYVAGVTPAMRISWGSRLFDIQSVINRDERNQVLFIMAVEHGN